MKVPVQYQLHRPIPTQIWIQANNGCTGLIGRVCVFDPYTNVSLNICDGFGSKKLRKSYPDKDEDADSLVDASARLTDEVEIHCHPVAAYVAKGKYLRVHVACAAFPRWPRDACTRKGDHSKVKVKIMSGSIELPLA